MKRKIHIFLISVISIMVVMVGIQVFGAEKRESKVGYFSVGTKQITEIEDYLSESEGNEIYLKNVDLKPTEMEEIDIESEKEEYSEEVKDSKSTIKISEHASSKTVKDFNFDEMKKIYALDHNLFEKLDKDVSLDENNAGWFVPFINGDSKKAVAVVQTSNAGELEVRAVIIPFGNEDYLLNYDEISGGFENCLNENDELDTIVMARVLIDSETTIIAYTKTTNGEKLVMPIQNNASYFGLERGKVYDFYDIYKK